jgi:hypothetical protein
VVPEALHHHRPQLQNLQKKFIINLFGICTFTTQKKQYVGK